jgi:hypothetical protein
MPPETLELISSLEESGWKKNNEDSSILYKDAVHFNVLQDSVKNFNNGAEVKFQGHGPGIRVRVKMAENLVNGVFSY